MESGRLQDTAPAELCRELATRQVTGRLTLVEGDLEAQVWFRDGSVYTATAPAARARLGDRLVGAGLLSEEQLGETLALQRTPGETRRIGELLIARGLVDRNTVSQFVREQSADSFAACMAMREGAWSFSPGEQAAEDVPLNMSVENLLMEGARRLEEFEVILARLGSLDAVVDFATAGSQADLSLTPDEWAMLTRIDGQSSVREIASDAGYSQLETARIIFGLLSAGVVMLVHDDEEPEAPAPVAAEAGRGRAQEGELPEFDVAELDMAELDTAGPATAQPGEVEPGVAAREGEGADDLGRGAAGRPDTPSEAERTPAPTQREPAAAARGSVDRNELLREFAALDEDWDEPERPAREESPSRPPRRPVPPPNQRSVPAPESDKERKGGLFGRFRKG